MNESNIYGVSLRGIIALIIVLSISAVCVIDRNATTLGILKDLALLVLGYYYGQKTNQPQTGGTNEETGSGNTAVKYNDTSESG